MTFDLRTRYLGLELRSPIVASAAPQNGEPAMARRLERAGVGRHRPPLALRGGDPRRGARDQPDPGAGHGALRRGARLLPGGRPLHRCGRPVRRHGRAGQGGGQRAHHRQPQRHHIGGWVRYARLIQTAGADALELNLYHVAADPERNAADMEAADLALIAAVREAVTIPLAVKLSPYYSAFANFAAAAVAAGADGLVLFNRFYQPDLDLEALEVVPRLELSQQWELRLPVRWIAILRPQLGAGRLAGRHLGRADRDRCRQGPDGRRRRGDDDLRPPAPRPRARPRRWRRSCRPGLRSTSTNRSRSCVAAPARPRRRTRPRSSAPTTYGRFAPG